VASFSRGFSVEAAGLPVEAADLDGGFVSLDEYQAAEFVARCRQLRYWDRQRGPSPNGGVTQRNVT